MLPAKIKAQHTFKSRWLQSQAMYFHIFANICLITTKKEKKGSVKNYFISIQHLGTTILINYKSTVFVFEMILCSNSPSAFKNRTVHDDVIKLINHCFSLSSEYHRCLTVPSYSVSTLCGFLDLNKPTLCLYHRLKAKSSWLEHF